jgi:hypothetical protein
MFYAPGDKVQAALSSLVLLLAVGGVAAAGGRKRAGSAKSEPTAAAELRGSASQAAAAGGSGGKGRWELDEPLPKKGKLMRDGKPLPTLDLTKTPVMGGRRHFYGRGCAIVDIDGDHHEECASSQH